jgi:hypothetical protein
MSTTYYPTNTHLDDYDRGILHERERAFNDPWRPTVPREGEFVRFADGTVRRISHVWRDEHDTVLSVQTSDSGSYYLGRGYMTMSGSLFRGVKPDTLKATEERMVGRAWFFHHDMHQAHNAVHVEIRLRVWDCSLEATT